MLAKLRFTFAIRSIREPIGSIGKAWLNRAALWTANDRMRFAYQPGQTNLHSSSSSDTLIFSGRSKSSAPMVEKSEQSTTQAAAAQEELVHARPHTRSMDKSTGGAGAEQQKKEEQEPKPATTTGKKRGRPRKADKEAQQAAAASKKEEEAGAASGAPGAPEEAQPTAEEGEPAGKKQKTEAAASGHVRGGDQFKDGHVVEKGHVFFFYRPKTQHDTVTSIDADVQRLYVLLKPLPNQQNAKARLIVVPKKHLPNIDSHEVNMALVDAVSDLDKISDITSYLKSTEYTTRTRGERHEHSARPIGEGRYAIVMRRRRAHLAFVLELPSEEHMKLPTMFGIPKEGSYAIQVKNPQQHYAHEDVDTGREPSYPEELQNIFHGTRWATISDARLMNFEGAHLILVGARKDIREELGEPAEQLEDEAAREKNKIDIWQLFRELDLPRGTLHEEPIQQEKLV